MPGWPCNRRAQMPFEWVATMWAARNHVLSGRWLRCRIVPAVTEVCRLHSAHSHVGLLRSSAQPFRVPQTGQMKPSGQRALVFRAGRVVGKQRLELLARDGAI